MTTIEEYRDTIRNSVTAWDISQGLYKVAKRWAVENGRVPFQSMYVPVVMFYLRQTSLDLTHVKVQKLTRAIKLIFRVPPTIHEHAEIIITVAASGEMHMNTRSWRSMSNEELAEERAASWDKYYSKHGLQRSDFGREFTLNNRHLKIIGAKSRVQNYGIICIDMDKNVTISVRAQTVKNILKGSDK